MAMVMSRDQDAGELPGSGAGGEGSESVPVDVGEPQLRAGVGAFPADDDPHALRPAVQVEQAGELAAAVGAVVGEHREWMEAIRLLPCRRGLLLVRARGHDGRVDVHHDLAAAAGAGCPAAGGLYSAWEKCLRLGADRSFDKPYPPRSKALLRQRRGTANVHAKAEARVSSLPSAADVDAVAACAVVRAVFALAPGAAGVRACVSRIATSQPRYRMYRHD